MLLAHNSFHRTDATSSTALIATAALVSLTLLGCAPLSLTRSFDGSPLRPSAEVAVLLQSTVKSDPSNVDVKLWHARVLEINGRPWNEDVFRYQLKPGTYKLKLYCLVPATATRAQITGEGVYEVQLTAGKTHYTWAVFRPTHQRQILDEVAPSQQSKRKPPAVRTVTLYDNCVNTMAHREPDF